MVVELATNFVISGFGLLVCLTAVDWLARSCGLLVWAAGSIGIGTNTHTSSHNATSNKRWVNELLTYLGYPVYFGLSATYWRHKHVVMHHSAPNVMGIDADADLSPWFATTADEIAHSSGMRRFYYERVQVLVFPIAIALTLFSHQIAVCVYVASFLISETI